MGSEEEKKEEQSNLEKQNVKKENTLEKSEENQDFKNKPEEIRKIIKINPSDKEQKKVDQQDQIDRDVDKSLREDLEQKRIILQTIKDLDFQIKKNQEDINAINQRLDSVIKDLDDLVSLYEIVSEQMNPFVGLSKVTKKRLDALENFTKEVEEIKTRLSNLEAFAEKAGANLQDFKGQYKDDKNTELPKINSIQDKDLSDDELEIILEKAFDSLMIEDEIEKTINEFIEKLT